MNNELQEIKKITQSPARLNNARIEFLVPADIKQQAKEKAKRECKDLSKILNRAVLEFLAN